MANIKTTLHWEIKGSITKDDVSNLPTYSGIYMVLCAEKNSNNEWITDSYKLIYIGEADNIRQRFEKRTDDEWKCLTDNCNKSLLVKTAKTDIDLDERQKVECCLINHNGQALKKCQTECIDDWPHANDTVEITNSGKHYPLAKEYKCGS